MGIRMEEKKYTEKEVHQLIGDYLIYMNKSFGKRLKLYNRDHITMGKIIYAFEYHKEKDK